MKKLLLLMVAAISTLAAWAITETPIMTYDYSTATETGLTTDYYCTTSNPSSSVWTAIGGDTRYNKGMLFLCGNFDSSNFPSLTKGISIQKMGGQVGNVLCINGATTSFNTATGLEAPEASFNPWWNMNWLTDPNNTPVGGSATQPKIRVRITFNVYNSSTTHVSIPKSAYFVNDANSAGTNDTSEDISSLSTSNFVDENGNWDSTKWCVYEFDTFCTSGSAPGRFKFELNSWANGITGRTLLIQKVEFFEISDYTSDEINVGTRKVSYKTMTVKYGEDKEEEETPAEDQTTIAATDVALAVADVTDYTSKTIAGSNEKYPAYYTKANAFDVNFTLTPDADKVAAGNTSLQATVEAHGGGGAVLGSAQTFTVDLSNYAEGSAIPCVMKNLPHRGSYYLALTKTKYNNETEENTIENGKTEIVSNSISAPTATFDFTTSPFIYKTSDNTYSVVFRDKLSFESSMVAVASFTVEQTDNTLDAGVLTSPWNVTLDGEKTDLGLNGYENRDGKDYDDAVHNWALIGAKEGYLPLHVANVNVSGTVTRKLSVEFPTLYAAGIAAEQGTSANATHTVTISNVNPTYLKASTDSATYNDNNELENAQTSVANIAVEANAAVEYFNLQGVRVAADALTPGIYVRRAGNTASKVIVK
jgi:hypothetical protein